MKFCINGTHESSQKYFFSSYFFLEALNSYRYYSIATYIFRDLEHDYSVWLLDTSFTKHDPSLIFIEDHLPI